MDRSLDGLLCIGGSLLVILFGVLISPKTGTTTEEGPNNDCKDGMGPGQNGMGGGGSGGTG